MISSNIIAIVVFYFMHTYLTGLKTCDCVNEKYVYHLRHVQQTLLFLNVVMLILSILLHYNTFPSIKLIEKHLFKLLILSGIFMTLFYTYVVYNTYYFYSTMGKDCRCADKWQKYYLYFDASIVALTLVSTILLSVYGAFHYKSSGKMI